VQLEKGVWEYLVKRIELGPYSTPVYSIGPRILLHKYLSIRGYTVYHFVISGLQCLVDKGVWEYLVRRIELGPYSNPFYYSMALGYSCINIF
jgi:hypothetical protein